MYTFVEAQPFILYERRSYTIEWMYPHTRVTLSENQQTLYSLCCSSAIYMNAHVCKMQVKLDPKHTCTIEHKEVQHDLKSGKQHNAVTNPKTPTVHVRGATDTCSGA